MRLALIAWALIGVGICPSQAHSAQDVLDDDDAARASSTFPSSSRGSHPTIDASLFRELERTARLVDISYCVGTGAPDIKQPFVCPSRCSDFPDLSLVITWHTGLLLQDSCGYIAVDRGARHEIIVAFRGTYSVADTVLDLSTVPQAYEPYEPGGGDGDVYQCPNCTVHSGFQAAWRSTRAEVLHAVAVTAGLPLHGHATTSPPSGAPPRIHLIGHSLGGAVAALAALEMKVVHGWTNVVVTTFGEPRIGNGQLATFLEDTFAPATFWRVTHVNDPVPLLPPAVWGYRAHASELYIAKEELPPLPKDVRVCTGRADPACSDSGGSGDSSSGTGNRLLHLLLFKPWELFHAHRDYFWKLGLCIPPGDPVDWWRR